MVLCRWGSETEMSLSTELIWETDNRREIWKLTFRVRVKELRSKRKESGIGGLQPISRDTDNNVAMVDEQKELMRNLLFSSTNMVAMTSRENHLYVTHSLKVGSFSHEEM